MSDWVKSKLEDLGTLQRGRSRHRPRYAFHLFGGKYPFIQTGEIRSARKYIREHAQTYNEMGLKQSKLWPKNTLCITIAANIAEIAILSFEACFPDSVLGFIPNKEKADLDFIYYTLVHFQRELKHIGEGSVQDNINLGTFQDILFPIPSLQEQQAIAAVLSSIDDKIDLLHRQNKTLEAMAETLFRQWFVEEAGEDWEEGKVKDLVDVQSGFAFKSSSFSDIGEHRLITIKAVQNGYLELSGADRIREIPTNMPDYCHLNQGDILLSLTGNVGRCCLVDSKNLVLNQRVSKLRPRKKRDWAFVYVMFRQSSMRKMLEEMAKGTAQANLSPIEMSNIEMPVPPIRFLECFSIEATPLLKKVLFNKSQIKILESLRDALLPKLMSGEVRVALQPEGLTAISRGSSAATPPECTGNKPPTPEGSQQETI